jgi:UDP-N-acetylmuramyl pentapeptide phosphotransferase/UDP-N-acetylglucosamine-1-phosphate transferase
MSGESYLMMLLGTGMLTSLVLRWFLRTDSVFLSKDEPSSRGLHDHVVPRGGGLAIFGCVAIAGVMVHLLQGSVNVDLDLLTIVSLTGIGVMGFLDDRFNLGVGLRLVAGLTLTTLLAVGSIGDHSLVVFGQTFDWSFGLVFLAGTIGLFWLMNLFNFMDGADGVAGVQSLIASGALTIWFAASGQEFLAVLNVGLAGACLAFLWFNWAPARVFMGDIGSLALGAWFGIMSLIGVSQSGLPVEAFLILLSVFVFDATLTLVHRLLKRKRITQAHREHLYQKLILAGWSHGKVAVLIGAMAFVAAVLATLVVWNPEHGLWFFLVALVMLLGYAILAIRASASISRRAAN